MVLVGRVAPALVVGQLILAPLGVDCTPLHYCPSSCGVDCQVQHPTPKTRGGLGRLVSKNRPPFLPFRACSPGCFDRGAYPRNGSRVAGDHHLSLGTPGGIGARGDGCPLFIRRCCRFWTRRNRRDYRFANFTLKNWYTDECRD